MAVTIFACPECGSTLKSKQALAAGTKIKCPKCQAIFAIPERDGAADADEEPRSMAGVQAPARWATTRCSTMARHRSY